MGVDVIQNYLLASENSFDAEESPMLDFLSEQIDISLKWGVLMDYDTFKSIFEYIMNEHPEFHEYGFDMCKARMESLKDHVKKENLTEDEIFVVNNEKEHLSKLVNRYRKRKNE